LQDCKSSDARYFRPVNTKVERTPVDPELHRRVLELIKFKGGGYNEEAVADIIENALKILQDVQDTGDVRVIQTAVRELRYAYRLFAPYSNFRKVTIFGSARTAPSKQEYQQAVDFGRKIVEAGFMVITGAGPGIMQAGHEGAGPENSFGVNIRLPWEQSANPIIREDKKLVTFKYFFTRKLIFIRLWRELRRRKARGGAIASLRPNTGKTTDPWRRLNGSSRRCVATVAVFRPSSPVPGGRRCGTTTGARTSISSRAPGH
jgi:hypothetical protein